jgi:hypothetical protein
LKQTPLLHWLVTPRDEIIGSNFLTGPNANHFTNLEQYDIVELRAVYLRLPLKFEFDRDGKKASWYVTLSSVVCKISLSLSL